MKRYMIMTTLLAAILLSATACAEKSTSQSTSQESQTSGSEQTDSELPNREADEDRGNGDRENNKNGGRDGQGGQGGGISDQDSEPDEELQAILDEVQDKYQLLSFTDPDTGFEMQYELFVPEGYDASESYPMIMFIPDSRAAGREAEYSLAFY